MQITLIFHEQPKGIGQLALVISQQSMKFKIIYMLLWIVWTGPSLWGQAVPIVQQPIEIALVSDTQAPLGIETLWHKNHQNKLATKKIFETISLQKPTALLILGDVVSLGSQESKWKEMDQYLSLLRSQGISIAALLGNHDLMYSSSMGEAAFLKRFPDQVNTGFYKVYDSIAFLMHNSNFKTLSQDQQNKQLAYYTQTLQALDADPAIVCVVVSCHHSPYSNSSVVGSNQAVQQAFVPAYLLSKKAKLFVTGHSHHFEHFKKNGKDFLTLGGGGGLHQSLVKSEKRMLTESKDYDPEFHYLSLSRRGNQLYLQSKYLEDSFQRFENGYHFIVK
jgi:UDP-2,3-diacylglucosamine pyrophosphatase LpxH